MITAVTIDFHDTLFLCDDWFMLEVRDLPLKYLEWKAEKNGGIVDANLRERVIPVYRELRHAVIESGVEIDAVENIERVCAALDLATERCEVAAAVDALMHATLANATPRPGAIDFVQAMKAAGIPVGIVSNAIYQPFLEWAVEAAGMHDLFDVVLTSARAGYYKSCPEIYLQASRELGVPTHAVIHIGDSLRFDVAGAAAAGMHTVWLDLGHESTSAIQPELTVSKLEGLADILFDHFQLGRPDAL